MSLPTDVESCEGVNAEGQWREGCEDCQRRTSPPANPQRGRRMSPPLIVVFECESRIPPEAA